MQIDFFLAVGPTVPHDLVLLEEGVEVFLGPDKTLGVVGVDHVDNAVGHACEEAPIAPGGSFPGAVVGQDGAGGGGDVVDF